MEILGVLEVPTWLLVLVFALVTLYIYFTYPYGHFKKLGIPGPTPYPVVGTMATLFKKGFLQGDRDFVRKYGKVFGVWDGKLPSVMVSDPDMLREILVKRADLFVNRRVIDFTGESMLLKNLLGLKDARWKHVRSIMTPTFSSGKLRSIAQLIRGAGNILVKNFETYSEEDKEFDCKVIFGNFTMDVISSTAFGVKVDSQSDPNDPFVTNAKEIFQFSLRNPLMALFFFFPFLGKNLVKCGVTAFPKRPIKFFSNIIDQIVDRRAKDTQKHKDFLQLMINANKKIDEKNTSQESNGTSDKTAEDSEIGLTDDELKAQAFLFFLAGYNTTAQALQFTVYHIATSQEIQQKCIEEVDEVLQGGEPDYDNTQNLHFMDMCLSEALRMYPPGFRFDRVAAEDVTINGWFFPKETVITVPAYAIHNDPEIYPDPEKFDPYRFTAEAKQARNPYTYLPFGMGPRNCIGLRLAQLEIRILLAQILQKFKFVPCEKTKIPLELSKKRPLDVEDGIWLKVQPRE